MFNVRTEPSPAKYYQKSYRQRCEQQVRARLKYFFIFAFVFIFLSLLYSIACYSMYGS
jgi:hypothetical protein